MDGTFAGVIDRIVDGETAVILIEEDGEVIEQFDVAVERLPKPAKESGGVLSVTIANDEIVDMEYRETETSERRQSIRERLARLSKRLSDRDR